MKFTYEPDIDVQDAASEALFRAIAMYKAAGFSRRAFEDMPLNFWNSIPAAEPEPKQ